MTRRSEHFKNLGVTGNHRCSSAGFQTLGQSGVRMPPADKPDSGHVRCSRCQHPIHAVFYDNAPLRLHIDLARGVKKKVGSGLSSLNVIG